jgi:uncharacterized protein (TIGR02996 family)
MTSEEDFQAALDANPEDWQMRLVFADWLQDRGDPRAEGYRALGIRKKRPFVCGFDNKATKLWQGVSWFALRGKGDRDVHGLPKDWFTAVEGLGDDPRYRPRYDDAVGPLPNTQRRQIEDAIARAFARLRPGRRAELLRVATPRKRRTAVKPKSGTQRAPAKPKQTPRKPRGKKAP